MAYDICEVCGKFFPKDGQRSCDVCRDKDKQEFDKLRRVVRQQPGILAFEASNITGIPINTIMRYVKERRIHISSENKDSGKIFFRDTLPEKTRTKPWERNS